MSDTKDKKTRLIAYDWDGKPLALIEMWLEHRISVKQQAVIVTLHSKVAVLK